jgi:hypothetical protein
MLLVEEVYKLNSISSTDAITNNSKAIPTPPNPSKPPSNFQNCLKWEK